MDGRVVQMLQEGYLWLRQLTCHLLWRLTKSAKLIEMIDPGEFDSKSFPDMNFTLEYVLQEDGKWGSYWERENKTTGLVHTIVSGRADITGKNYSS